MLPFMRQQFTCQLRGGKGGSRSGGARPAPPDQQARSREGVPGERNSRFQEHDAVGIRRARAPILHQHLPERGRVPLLEAN